MNRPARRPIVVIGAGVAGLATALAAAPAPVVVLCRDADGGGSASALAQGGIAAALDPGDSAQAHACDTLAAGAGHNHAAAVEWLCRQAPGAVTWLADIGVEFDRGCDGRLALGREGGHGTARIVHAGGDATGAALMRVLHARARAAVHIEWRGGLEVEALLLREGRVCGARARDRAGNEHVFDASAVVLATGGLGALFARTSNPAGADGAGLALALAAGARARDLEFVQFHPTALEIDGQCLPLLTEALRGAGASLRDHDGRALMAGVHPLGDLAPRDIVARRVWHARRNGRVWLDARGVRDDFAQQFPTVLAACQAHGFDPRREPLPVTPVAHFHMGGVAVDTDGATSLPGLHAVGEVACTGVHGANRLASNSLLEGVACGRRLGARLSTQVLPAPRGAARWHAHGEALPAAQLERLRALLWSAAGPLRTGPGLRGALAECAAWVPTGWQARLACALLEAALRRTRSLGAHHRSDAEASMRYRMAGVS
ncbi:L-aspartate oxidase [Lysobacter niabensis]|uniref:L-aspartate oxidase n=1 Tax=Agrilutibacter niabensis TaxID=380628 RepID=A0ABU1VNG8_9GAMM|nr:L-aspartate oxidase [Lysobacter niabensis]MDR7099024.1 L-aspartate oxidase [Lysobacter niabensis]